MDLNLRAHSLSDLTEKFGRNFFFGERLKFFQNLFYEILIFKKIYFEKV